MDDLKDIKIAVITALTNIQDNYNLTGWVRSDSVDVQNSQQVMPSVIRHRCYKCANEEILPSQVDNSSSDSMEYMCAINKWHKFSAEMPGYGSVLDMSSLEFELCDTCLYDIIQGFELRDEISPDTAWNYALT